MYGTSILILMQLANSGRIKDRLLRYLNGNKTLLERRRRDGEHF